MRTKPRLLFINRSYWPDVEATGQLLAELCENLSEQYDVTVIAGQPNCNPDHTEHRVAGVERHRGVRVRRVWHTRFSKASVVGRAVNYVSFLLTVTAAVLRERRPAAVIVETDPFLLPLLGWLLRCWHKCALIVYLQDIFPDIAVALGKIRPGRMVCCLRKLLFAVYSRADQTLVIGEDMRQVLIESGTPSSRVHCISNWADTERIAPVPEELDRRNGRRFLVMYSGNLGQCQGLEEIISAAGQLQHRQDIDFHFVGGGSLEARLKALAAQSAAGNVRFFPYRPKSMLAESLGQADLHLLPVDPRVARLLMPSKLYGILAAGRPLLAIAPDASELARIVREEQVGLVIPPGNAQAFAQAIEWCASHRRELAAMGSRARALAVRRYSRSRSTGAFAALLRQVLDEDGSPARQSWQPQVRQHRSRGRCLVRPADIAATNKAV